MGLILLFIAINEKPNKLATLAPNGIDKLAKINFCLANDFEFL